MPVRRTAGGIMVMEHREPPRIATSGQQFDDAAERAGGRFRLRRFDEEGNHRKIDYRRAGLLISVGLALVAGMLYLTHQARRVSLDWLAHQSQYQLPFDQIELAPETPRWYQGGPRAFLERVRLGAGEPENIAVLEVPQDHLAVAFKKYAWVEEVVKVAYPPGRIRVDVRYRKPAAWVQLQGAEQRIVDRNGIILPTDDVDVAALGQVIKISGHGLLAPSDPRPGVVWKSSGDGPGLDRPDERILAASKLAAFFVQGPQANDSQKYPALHLREIIVTDFDVRGLFVINDEGTTICWGSGPGTERPNEHSAEEKWAILHHWAETARARFLEPGDYWSFSKTGLQHRCPHRKDPHRPKESSSDVPGGAPVATRKSPLSG
jgi:hypothetical protein